MWVTTIISSRFSVYLWGDIIQDPPHRVPRYIKHTVWHYVPVDIILDLRNRCHNFFTTTLMWGKVWILGFITKLVQESYVSSQRLLKHSCNIRNKARSADNTIFPRILPNEGETTGNDVPVRAQRRYCEGQFYMIMNSYSLVPEWNLCICYVKFELVSPEQIRFWLII